MPRRTRAQKIRHQKLLAKEAEGREARRRWLERHTEYVRGELNPNRKHALQLTAMSTSKYGLSHIAIAEIYDVVEIDGINTYQKALQLNTSFLGSNKNYLAEILDFFREKHKIVNPEYTFLSVYSEGYAKGDSKTKEILEERLKGLLTPIPEDIVGKMKLTFALFPPSMPAGY